MSVSFFGLQGSIPTISYCQGDSAQQATPSLVAPNKEYLLLVYGKVQLISAEFIWAWLQIVRWAQVCFMCLSSFGGQGPPWVCTSHGERQVCKRASPAAPIVQSE